MSENSLNANPISIAVTPLATIGSETICAIDPMAGNSGHIKGGVIKLTSGSARTLSFEIQPGSSSENFSAAGDDAFWCRQGSCPTEKGVSGFLTNPRVPDGKTLLVDANPPQGSSGIMFYRLNFDDGTHFDPIIIHN
jgi:hypothetical protein